MKEGERGLLLQPSNWCRRSTMQSDNERADSLSLRDTSSFFPPSVEGEYHVVRKMIDA